MFNPFTSSVPAELYPPPPDKRADSLAIKQAIAQSLSEQDGVAYWSLLVSFIKGKLDRIQFESQTQQILNSEKLVGLHNALILSILYNTTRPDSPPLNPPDRPNLYTTGEGWHKRKRIPPKPMPPKPKIKVEEKDPKKQKLKQVVMSLGQRERNRLKKIAVLKDKESEQLLKLNPSYLHTKLFNSGYLCQEPVDNVLNTSLASKMRISSSTLYQDYMRCQQAPLCAEAKQLPDFDNLKDRMTLIAYDSGLVNGVDKTAGSLALIALEVHLKTLLGDLLALIRSDRSIAGSVDTDFHSPTLQSSQTPHLNHPTTESSQLSTAIHHSSYPDALSNNGPSTLSQSPMKSVSLPLANPASSNLRLRDMKTQGLAPHLTARDFTALAEISPHAFVRSHPGALERLISTHSGAVPGLVPNCIQLENQGTYTPYIPGRAGTLKLKDLPLVDNL
ncbi:hypothetical protein O181_049400 [Austropuccinia psidii MF-1]|uniref:Transcriptional coactivator HFI1/ADA1 n=1 Tax=Austropuccinia psidii MF-1 TaxID=1389203 RepID=A0A9Q3DTI7_9BASI|nr:hypothetical protein [Austropuccinia psidii MF-1]